MKVGWLKRRALASYFLTSGHRRGLVVLIRKSYGSRQAPPPNLPPPGEGTMCGGRLVLI
jgi:hypothetical protein